MGFTKKLARGASTIGMAVAFAATLGVPSAYAWDQHAYLTDLALSQLPGLPESVRVEPLTAVLDQNPAELARILDAAEAAAKALNPNFLPRPAALAFDPTAPAAEREARFFAAMRINPKVIIAPAARQLGSEPPGRQRLEPKDVSLLPNTLKLSDPIFWRLEFGESVDPRRVLAIGSDEPDYGLDLGLFEDNGTEQGRVYGFGRQPFGNPVYEFSSPSPFHMGFFHESGFVYKGAPFLRHTFPELRLAQTSRLARFAFATGHSYWGFRFLGWGLHYVQDLTQPYHSKVLPGASTARLLFINTLALVGWQKPKVDAIQVLNNRHLALENYVFKRLAAARREPNGAAPVAAALSSTEADGGYPPYGDGYARDVISAEAFAGADAIDALIEKYVPAALVSDPDYIFGKTDPSVDVARALLEGPPEADRAFAAAVSKLLKNAGVHSRNFVRAAMKGAPP